MRPVPLSAEAGTVLMVLVRAAGTGLRLNDLSARTGLPTGHVGRHPVIGRRHDEGGAGRPDSN